MKILKTASVGSNLTDFYKKRVYSFALHVVVGSLILPVRSLSFRKCKLYFSRLLIRCI